MEEQFENHNDVKSGLIEERAAISLWEVLFHFVCESTGICLVCEEYLLDYVFSESYKTLFFSLKEGAAGILLFEAINHHTIWPRIPWSDCDYANQMDAEEINL